MSVKQPFFQIRGNCLVSYELPMIQPPRGDMKLRVKAYSGQTSKGSVSRIRKAIDILLQKSPERIIYNTVTKKYQPFTINFVTLTVSSQKNISINEGYQNLLRPYLRRLKRSGKISYMWKAEFQKRGQLHYHITTNRFVPWSTIRNDWNNLQRKHRYLDSYAKKNRHFDANSTDVHAVYKINDIGAYLGKYMSKPVLDPSKQIPFKPPVIEKGKIWDCSVDLKCKRFAFTPTGAQEIEIMMAVRSGRVKTIVLDHCVIYKYVKLDKFLTHQQKTDYTQWLK